MRTERDCADHPRTIALTEVYPNLRVPVPGEGEWLDFLIAVRNDQHCLYWRLNDGSRHDPDTVEFGFISAHKSNDAALVKKKWLERSQRALGLTA